MAESVVALRGKLERAKSTLRNVREGARRMTAAAGGFALQAGTGYATGLAHGYVEAKGKTLDIPGTKVSGTLVGGLVGGVAGIAMDVPLLTAAAGGVVGADLALTGYKQGTDAAKG